MLERNQNKRPTAGDLLNHPWLNDNAPMAEDIARDMQEYTSNIKQFYMASNFQKMILSMIVGMRKQKEELGNIR